ncbi:hypothetical protein ASE43_03995 [Lysobacter sp. Root983]|nr:hypothetical protein ASE43_03995 [Lysobacter sp. Root983]
MGQVQQVSQPGGAFGVDAVTCMNADIPSSSDDAAMAIHFVLPFLDSNTVLSLSSMAPNCSRTGGGAEVRRSIGGGR